MKGKTLELNTSNKKLFNLDFNRSPQSIYSQWNTKEISNLSKDQDQKSSQSKENWLKNVLWKITSLIHYFKWILGFPLEFSMSFKKVPCMTLYSWKMGVWNGSQMKWDLFQTSTLM